MSTSPEPKPRCSLRDKARRVLPAGTFGNTSADLVIAEGRGSRVWDENGKEYIDYLIGSGPMIVGHAHPEVVACMKRGASSFRIPATPPLKR